MQFIPRIAVALSLALPLVFLTNAQGEEPPVMFRSMLVGTLSLPNEPLLKFAERVRPRVIVMGAFGACKRSELVLGGVTQFMLENAEMPLVMAH